VDGSADGAEIQFSLQPQLSALDVGLMERLLYLYTDRLIKSFTRAGE
jgi:hypothetical protein